jgi:hypothetical protein
MNYKGRKGRLAIIDSADLQTWIMDNFDLPKRHGADTWIGLRYMCRNRELYRVNGEKQPSAAFSFWDVPWHRTDIRCATQKILYMPVYLRAENYRWQACGPHKGFAHYLVEYPPM